MGEMHGKGTLWFKNHNRYEGEMMHNKMHGEVPSSCLGCGQENLSNGKCWDKCFLGQALILFETDLYRRKFGNRLTPQCPCILPFLSCSLHSCEQAQAQVQHMRAFIEKPFEIVQEMASCTSAMETCIEESSWSTG